MNLETELDPLEVNQHVEALEGVICAIEPALDDDEYMTLKEISMYLEKLANIETEERYVESPITGVRYRTTRWVDLGDGKIVALEKTAVGQMEADQDGE